MHKAASREATFRRQLLAEIRTKEAIRKSLLSASQAAAALASKVEVRLVKLQAISPRLMLDCLGSGRSDRATEGGSAGGAGAAGGSESAGGRRPGQTGRGRGGAFAAPAATPTPSGGPAGGLLRGLQAGVGAAGAAGGRCNMSGG